MGAMLIKIPGEDTGTKADLLASRLREALADMVVKVSRPARMAELRITGLDDSISSVDVAMAIGKIGGTSWLEIKTGEIRRTLRSMGALWVRCPLEAVIRVAEQGKLVVGWSSARVELLRRRLLQCYRCLAVGHVRARCPSQTDRNWLCHNCGLEGHVAGACRFAPRCSVCAERGLDAAHRAGAEGCRPIPSGRTSPVQVGLAERIVVQI